MLPHSSALSNPDPNRSQPAESTRILVVDDIFDNSFLLQTVLEQEGYQVDIASSGAEALTKIRTEPPNLILLDVMMPEMDGFEVTRRIRQDHTLPFMPILLITGYESLDASEAFATGADDFIRKPIDFTELLDRIQAVLPDDPAE